MNMYYVPILPSNGSFHMDEIESNHCVKVLRHKVGDIVVAFDGSGNKVTARIMEAHPKKCCLDVVSVEVFEKPKPNIHIAIAPTKNTERIEWFVEKSVEIGITNITFLQCEKSERKNINVERVEKIVISALKQSLQFYRPKVSGIVKFSDFCAKAVETEQRFIAHCDDTEKTDFKRVCEPGKNTVVLIGPEGDFSNNEINVSRKFGFEPVTFGEKRYRTETAGIVACHIINILNN